MNVTIPTTPATMLLINFESECHCAILVDRHLVDYSKPQFFVKLSYGKRSALNVFDEAFDDFALAKALSLDRFQLIDLL